MPNVAVPAMPYRVEDPAGFQAFISTWTIDTFLNSYLKSNTLSGWFKSRDVADSWPIALTTDRFNLLLPGIKKHYGKHRPVNVFYEVKALRNFAVEDSNNSVSVFGDLRM